MDLRTRTIMLCAAFALAITVSILLRARKRRTHYLLSGFAGTVSLWYLAQALFGYFQADIWYRFTAILAVLLPQFALHLFESLAPAPPKARPWLLTASTILGLPMLVFAVSGFQTHGWVRGAIFLYVFGLVAAGLAMFARQGRKSPSRAIRERIRPLVAVGASALAFSIVDFIWFIGAEIPPVGAVLSVVFLFALSESIRQERLIDLYELVGHLIVSTALAFCLAGIFYIFVTYVNFETMYLNAVLAAIAILVLFEPLRVKVEGEIHSIFFRQRRELEKAVQAAEMQLVHVLRLDEMTEVVMDELEASRRITAGAFYLLAEDNHLRLKRGFGIEAAPEVDVATARPLLLRLKEAPSLIIEAGSRWDTLAPSEPEAILSAAGLLGPIASSAVILGISQPNQPVVGLLVVQDARVRDAFSSDDIALLERLVKVIRVVMENSRAYERMKERDRLAVLGHMAAGLAHEIKNPLGSIKGAAQLLVDSSEVESSQANRDFLAIILEEVDRLDRVVGSVLDYARPQKGNPEPMDLNGVVERSVQFLRTSCPNHIQLELTLAPELPKVRMDPEHIRQVLLNLFQNAVQALGERPGTLTLVSRIRSPQFVELTMKDTGPGISAESLDQIFVPFFSTKPKGTGLGLAISQRIAQDAGGSIEVRSEEGKGSTFTMLLPACQSPIATPSQRAT